jgi:hypothetical protein
MTDGLYFSEIFGVPKQVLDGYAAFDISLLNDLPLFIDPFLLFNSSDPRYTQLHEEMIEYLRFLKTMSEGGEIRDGLLRAWFTFPEVKQTWLGYSLVGNRGAGLGMDFARALHGNLQTVFAGFGAETVTRGSHLEKLCLIQEGVGRDNISDFTTNLIKPFLLDYTQAFARKHLSDSQRRAVVVPKVRFNFQTRSWTAEEYELPFHSTDYVILTPKNILTREDTWINKSDMYRDFEAVVASIPNDQLRAQINDYFLRVLGDDPKKKDRDAAKARVILQNPSLYDYFIRYKEDHGEEAVRQSAERVRDVESIFIQNVLRLVGQLRSETDFYRTPAGTYEEARQRVLFLKSVIEEKGGHRLFYDAKGMPIRRESDLQILFRFTWFGTVSDVSREVNDGRGPVDFKVSRGARDKSLVEFKLAKSSHLKRNLEKQLKIYEKASDAPHSLFAILYFSEAELVKAHAILKELKIETNKDIILIDGSPDKLSGSKA